MRSRQEGRSAFPRHLEGMDNENLGPYRRLTRLLTGVHCRWRQQRRADGAPKAGSVAAPARHRAYLFPRDGSPRSASGRSRFFVLSATRFLRSNYMSTARHAVYEPADRRLPSARVVTLGLVPNAVLPRAALSPFTSCCASTRTGRKGRSMPTNTFRGTNSRESTGCNDRSAAASELRKELGPIVHAIRVL